MALPVNKLGDQTFLFCDAVGEPGTVPEGLMEVVETTQRAGVNGTGFIFLGQKGKPFELRSFTDVDTYADGLTLAKTYRDLVGTTDPQVLILNDFDTETEWGVQYMIIGLRPPQVRRMRAASGGVSTSKGAIVIANWLLCPIEQT